MTKKALLHRDMLPDILLKLEKKSFDAVGTEYGASGMTVKRLLLRNGVDLKPYLATRGGDRRKQKAAVLQNEPKQQPSACGKNGPAIREKPFRSRKRGEWPEWCLLKTETEYPDEYPYNATHLPVGEYFSPLRGASSAYTASLYAERGSWEL